MSKSTQNIKKVTRYIKKEVERELWARAAGRCQFNGCNRIALQISGKPERELAELFRRRAEDTENECFQRFAVTLRGLADGYDKEAERVIAEHR
ncbi:MAG: hypothetical protein OEM02_03550 [Desulfobulbaceae bacterium]|nr:hypothetical protein [Desulfobulbaceae bacterium]